VEWVETTGQDIDEAKERALDELGVDADEAEFEIVEEAKAGLFGLVRKEARVRARIRPTQPRPKVERRRGRGRGGNGRGQRDADTAGSSPAEATPAPERAPGDRGEGGRQRSGGSRRRGSGKGKGSRTSTGTASVRTETSDGEEPMDEVSVDQQVEVIEDFLEGLVEAFGLEGEIANERVEDEIVEIQVEGDDLGLLIGPKGQTLAAIGELGRTVAQRRLPGPHQGRVRLDVAGYRKRRAEALTRFALQVADDVKENGVPKVLEPMSPVDRKVVHDALTDVEGVRTASEGEDNRRRVVVLPD
jgi:spoIIIJ-associated protein